MSENCQKSCPNYCNGGGGGGIGWSKLHLFCKCVDTASLKSVLLLKKVLTFRDSYVKTNKNRRKNSKEAFLNQCKIETIAKSNGQLKTCPRTRAQPVREYERHGEQG